MWTTFLPSFLLPFLPSSIYDEQNSILRLPHEWETDPREPYFKVDLSHYFIWWNGNDQPLHYGFYFPCIEAYLEIMLLMTIESFISGCIAIIVYKYIIQKQPKQGSSPMSSYLLGYGFILPFWIFFPSYIINTIGVRNKVFRFCIGAIGPTISIFRTTEAMHGTSDPNTTKSLKRYIFYYSVPLIPCVDKSTNRYIRCSKWICWSHLFWFNVCVSITGIFHSIQFSFPDHLPQFNIYHQYSDEEWFHWKNIFRWEQVLTTIYYAAFIDLYLRTISHGFTFLSSFTFGLQFRPVMDDPLFRTTSITDFWGKRWNLLVHHALQRGVYKPIRQLEVIGNHNYSKYIAMILTFVASALFHEWHLSVIFFTGTNTNYEDEQEQSSSEKTCTWPDCYQPAYGYASVFFLWQAILMIGEYWIGRWNLFQSIPVPVKTIVIVSLGACTGHYFLAPYVRSDYMTHGSVLFPLLLPMPSP